MSNKTIQAASIFGGTAVIVLALAAHAFENLLEQRALESFKTAGEIQLFHAIALLAISQLKGISQTKINRIRQLMIAGICCFSLSIYLLTLRHELGIPWIKIIGPITPIGGILLITSWVLLFKAGMNNVNPQKHEV
jgi:uncharacterized membrane protein YgdD (TMEM256/DUF423 family)